MADIIRDCRKAVCYLLDNFPCVAVLGARQVGKTTLLKQALPDADIYDLERRADFQQIKTDPDFFLSLQKKPIIIDEAQLLPALFPALRVAIDAGRSKKGRYLISGSASPELLSHISESLAGRVAVFELEGFSLSESWQTKKSAFFANLEKNSIEDNLRLNPALSIDQLMQSCLLGSYPEPLIKYKNDGKLFELWMENYFQTYVKRDIRNLFPGLNIQNYQSFISMLAGSSGQMLNASEFARSLEVSQPTVKSYFRIAHGTFIWRNIASYQKNINKRVVKMPKGYLRDCGLLNFLLGNSTTKQMQRHPLFGRIWESFITEEIIKGLNNSLARVNPFYYRTSNQAEIDLVLEIGPNLLPIEIKSSTTIHKRSITSLKQFVQDHDLDWGLVINNASKPCLLADKIMQIPAACLAGIS